MADEKAKKKGGRKPKDGSTSKNLGHMLAFRLNDDDEKLLQGICDRSKLSRPKVVKALIRMAEGKTIKVKSETTASAGA